MLTADRVKNYLKTIIEPFLASDITTDFHSEFYYNPEAVANFTIKLLTGNIQAKITQLPIQLIVEVDNVYLDDVVNALNELAITYNETIAEIDDNTFRQFYSTPVVIGTFKNEGLEVKSTISVDISFLTFENLLDLTSLKINNEEIAFLRTGLTYTANVNSTGALYGANPGVVKQLVMSTANSFFLSCILKHTELLDEILINKMLQGLNPNKKYNIDFTFSNGKQITLYCILVSAAINKEVNGFPLIDLTFMRGDF